MRNRIRVLAALVLAALAAPAAAQKNGAAAPDDTRPVSFYVDSAAAVRALAALPAPELPEHLPPLFSLAFDSTGAVDVAEGVYPQLPTAFAEAVASLLRAHARRQPASDDPPVVFLRVAAGSGAAISRVEVALTPPEWLDRGFGADLLKPVLLRREEAVGRDRVMQVQVRARVLADGSVDPASVSRLGSTGDGEIDRHVVAVVHHLRFRPGTVDGIPAPVWVVVPFELSGGMAGPHSEYQATPVEMVSRAAPLSALVDSAAMARELAGVPALANTGSANFRVRFDTAGAVSGVEPIRPELPQDRARALAETIRRHVRRQPASPEPLHLHLRVVPGSGARVERPGLGITRAVIQNQEQVRRLVREAPVKAVADVVFAVTADGALDPSTIEFVGSAPAPEVAAEAHRIVRQMRFRRGSVGGVPASTWLRLVLWLGQPPEF